MERMPSEHLNTRDQFMDYIGNPLNGVLGALHLLQKQDLSQERKETLTKNLRESWSSIFARLEIFKHTEFQSIGGITHENVNKLFAFQSKDPFEKDVLDEFNALYQAISKV